jgi:hypothetical protein
MVLFRTMSAWRRHRKIALFPLLVYGVLMLGSCGDDDGQTSGAKWDEITRLMASDTHTFNKFGISMALDGENILVGADYAAGGGAVYVFAVNSLSGKWEEVTKLATSDASPPLEFGRSVALSGETALVGALYGDGVATNSGTAYVFAVNSVSGDWEEIKKLAASDAQMYDEFGISIALSGKTAVVGAHYANDIELKSGAAYVFAVNSVSGEWEEVTKLTASDAESLDLFGSSVALDGETAVVGAHSEDSLGTDAGAVYVFAVNSVSGEWEEVAKLTASDGQAGDVFGISVALSGETVVVGASREDTVGSDAGAAYVFAVNSVSGEWDEVKKLTAPDGRSGDWFGLSVDVSGETVVVGARYEDGIATDAGAAYVFAMNSASGEWEEGAKLTASDAYYRDEFGWCVAVRGETVVVGAPFQDRDETEGGAAYVYELIR